MRGSRASRAGVLVIPVIVFGGHEDLFRLFLGLLRLWRFRLIASFVGVRIAFRLVSYFGARGALLGLFPFSVLALMASESSDHIVLAHVDSRCRLLSLETSLQWSFCS